MPERMNAQDVSFLYLEEPTTPMHVGGVAVFQVPETGFDYERLVSLIRDRIALVPRYRQRLRSVPANLASPVWVDDEAFDVTYHVRRSALPRPGTDEQLRDLVARIMSRPLDRKRPLWEMYLVEGLEHRRFAIITKTHHAMVDGVAAVDIAQVILDQTPEPRQIGNDLWRPRPEPGSVSLVTGALVGYLQSPAVIYGRVREGVSDVHQTISGMGRNMLGLASAARTVARPVSDTALNADIGEQRRYGTAAMRLDDLKRIRKAHGGTINDVVLAVVAGALRSWLMTRGEAVTSRTNIRAMVPVSVRSDSDEKGVRSGNSVAAFLCDLPVGEQSPVIRLQRISFEMDMLKETGQMVGAQALVGVASFTPPTLHALGARLASSLSRRMFNVVVTNVPGPQVPLYAAGAEMLSAYPVVPLSRGQAVSIGLTSYNGGVFFGLNADRDAMPDIDVLAACLEDSMQELLDTTTPTGRAKRLKA